MTIQLSINNFGGWLRNDTAVRVLWKPKGLLITKPFVATRNKSLDL